MGVASPTGVISCKGSQQFFVRNRVKQRGKFARKGRVILTKARVLCHRGAPSEEPLGLLDGWTSGLRFVLVPLLGIEPRFPTLARGRTAIQRRGVTTRADHRSNLWPALFISRFGFVRLLVDPSCVARAFGLSSQGRPKPFRTPHRPTLPNPLLIRLEHRLLVRAVRLEDPQGALHYPALDSLGGWAVNLRMRLSASLGQIFTCIPPLPKSARKEKKDAVVKFVREFSHISFRFRKKTTIVLITIFIAFFLIWLLMGFPGLKS